MTSVLSDGQASQNQAVALERAADRHELLGRQRVDPLEWREVPPQRVGESRVVGAEPQDRSSVVAGPVVRGRWLHLGYE